MKYQFLFLLASLLFAPALFSQSMSATKKDSVLKIKKVEDFDLSGVGKAAAWSPSEWVSLPKRKGEVNYKTQFKMVYSGTGIYCLFFCEDEKITSTIKKDFGDLFKEDVVEVFFWPDESSPIYFEYELSPHNFELPILVPNYQGDFYGWLPWGLKGGRKTRHATKIIKEGGKVKAWMAEFFIPFALLRPLQNISPKAGTRWRANFYRIDYDKGTTHFTWKPVNSNFHDFERFGIIEFQ
jgi:hypothetical protein